MPEARVLTQLVEALLFERVATWASERHPLYGSADREIAFQLSGSAYRCDGRVGAFGRVRLASGSVVKNARGGWRRAAWQEVLADVPGEASVKAAIAGELESTERFCRWNRDNLPALRRSRRALDYAALEGALHEGHPYHPCFKARTGFSLDDHASFGPEAGNTFKLRWLAVRRSELRQALPAAEADFYCSELGAEAQAAIGQGRQRVNAPASEYGLMPVHPWQWRQLMGMPSFMAALARRELTDLEVDAGLYRATQSLRTVLSASDPLAAHVKLSLAVRVSSSLRTLQPETVHAAPALSRWLQALVAADPFFSEVAGLTVLAEYASVSYAPTLPARELADQLGAIWREPIGRHLAAEEAAVPFNALFACESDGLPYVDPWIERHGLETWVQHVLAASVLPVWRLLAHHGVAVEAHAQNMILMHRQGLPRRLALRDFHDSLEYVPGYLAAPERVPDFAALDERFRAAPLGRYYAMPSVEALCESFMDCVCVFNLSELSWFLARHYGFRETEFWRLARRVLDDYNRSAWASPEREARLAHRRAFVRTESLFTARLSGSPDASFQHAVPSALAQHAHRGNYACRQ